MNKLTPKQQEAACFRLQHIQNTLDSKDYGLAYLKKDSDGVKNGTIKNMFGFNSYTECKAMSTWFHTGNLEETKNWFFNRAKLIYIQENPPFESELTANIIATYAFDGLFFIVADYEPLIQWYATYDERFDTSNLDNTKNIAFYTKQFFIALRGEMQALGERAEQLLANPPKSSPCKYYVIDQQFYLALAKGDVAGMESVINELLTPKLIRNRADMQDGYTAGLICTPAIIYSKLALRNGYKLNIEDSPYVPKEWVEIKPLSEYQNAFEFMNTYKFDGGPTVLPAQAAISTASNNTTSSVPAESKKPWQFWK